jgi:hypothetical protein
MKSAGPKHTRAAYKQLFGSFAPIAGKRGEIVDREYRVGLA